MPTDAVVQKQMQQAQARFETRSKHAPSLRLLFLEEQSGSRAAKSGTLQKILKRSISAEATSRSSSHFGEVFGRKHWHSLHHGSRRRARNMEKIFDQSQITDILVKRNQTHFGQTHAHRSLFLRSKNWLGYHGTSGRQTRSSG
jgi:hypothetical protein